LLAYLILSSSIFIELLVSGVVSVAYKINGRQQDLKSCTDTNSESIQTNKRLYKSHRN